MAEIKTDAQAATTEDLLAIPVVVLLGSRKDFISGKA